MVISILGLYTATGIHIRRVRLNLVLSGSDDDVKMRGEIRLTLIALFITLPVTLSAIVYNPTLLIPGLSEVARFIMGQLGRFFGNVAFILNPFVYFAFSSDIRAATLQFYLGISPRQQLAASKKNAEPKPAPKPPENCGQAVGGTAPSASEILPCQIQH